MILTVFNTLGMRKEKFVPLRPKEIHMYVCGPTVYDFIHIGNGRAFIVADVVRRYLEYSGFAVRFVSNITDVDDKTIRRTKELGMSLQQLGEFYSDAYFEDMSRLNIRKSDVHPRATQHISEIVEHIQILTSKGYAYEAEGDVYFDITKFEDYGKLSGNKAEALEMGARIEVNPKKRNPSDFVLWKSQKKDEPAWHSPWGKGRPGWHIECSTMAMQYLGQTIDIHMGGRDLVFPHHENEIAQAEAATGRPFAKYWLHNEWLTIDGKKMSKSLGNFITVRDALKTCKPQVLRLFLISAHYRSPMDYNRENLKLAETNFEKLSGTIKRLKDLEERTNSPPQAEKLLSETEKAKERFEEAMSDDFNTPLALSALFDIVKAINSYADEAAHIGPSAKKQVSEVLMRLVNVLGVEIEAGEPQRAQMVDVENLMNVIISLRQTMRMRNEWQITDKIREEIQKIGYVLEDTPEGTKWKKKS